MKKILLFILIFSSGKTFAQGVGIGTSNPVSSALLELSSTDKGLLVPRMTRANRDNISLPSTGLLIYQTNETPGFVYNAGNSVFPNWVRLSRRLDTIVVGPEAFAPLSSSVAYATNALTARYIPTDGSTAELRASVNLPAGVTVTTMKAYFYDRSSSDNITFELRENYLTEGLTASTPFTYTSSGSLTTVRTATITDTRLVKSNLYSYFISVRPASGSTWNFEADLAIKGVMLIFEY